MEKKIQYQKIKGQWRIWDVQGEMVDSWKERLPEIIHGYTNMMFGIWMDYHHFLKVCLSKIDECSTATDFVKSVNIFIAVRWVAKAWSIVRQKPFQEGRYFRLFYGYGHP